jgi:hypothetical protein
VTAIFAGVVPFCWLTDNQLPPDDVVVEAVNVPAAGPLITKLCAAGTAFAAGKLNTSELALTETVLGTAERLAVSCGLLEALDDAIVTVQL